MGRAALSPGVGGPEEMLHHTPPGPTRALIGGGVVGGPSELFTCERRVGSSPTSYIYHLI